jgi:hypothetical protein
MSTKSRQTIYGGRIMGAEIRAQGARAAAEKAVREEAEGWSIRMEGCGGPAQPYPTIGQLLRVRNLVRCLKSGSDGCRSRPTAILCSKSILQEHSLLMEGTLEDPRSSTLAPLTIAASIAEAAQTGKVHHNAGTCS